VSLSQVARLLVASAGLTLAVGVAVVVVACVDGTTPNCADAGSACGPDLNDATTDGPPLADAPAADAPSVDAPSDAPAQDTGTDAGAPDAKGDG
jgi:hypothetical protein